jgi:hypothetical protein
MAGNLKELAGQALDCAIHDLPEPRSPWREAVPPENLGKMLSDGSANIPLFALVATLWFGIIAWAAAVLRTYAAVCRKRFMLAEPWSLKYGQMIVLSWAAVVYIARRRGDPELADLFMQLLRSFFGTARLMAAKLEHAPPGATKGEKARVGSMVVCMPGCRSVGEHLGLASGIDELYAIGMGAAPKKSPNPPGTRDDQGWTARAQLRLLSILREAAQDFRGDLTVQQILERTPRWAAREAYTLYGWADGSRLGTMGKDEPEVVDEDDNGNTLGSLARGIFKGRFVVAPIALTRIRQKSVKADIDGNPLIGWLLKHSMLGDQRAPDGDFLTFIPPYREAALEFAILIPEGNPDGWTFLNFDGEPTAPPAPPASPAPPPAQRPPRPPKPPWYKRTSKRMRAWRAAVAEWEARWG